MRKMWQFFVFTPFCFTLHAGNSYAGCDKEIGKAGAQILAHRCMEISFQNNPICRVSADCHIMDREIDERCNELENKTSTPSYCKFSSLPKNGFAATMIGGGGLDDMRIALRTSDYRRIHAYCSGVCGDWFFEKNAYYSMKPQFINNRVFIKLAQEANDQRVLGPGDNEILIFAKQIRFLKPSLSPRPLHDWK